MTINLATRSWNEFDKEYAKSYLHDGDMTLLRALSKEIFENLDCSLPKILDIGCGNCRLYRELSYQNRNFEYYGIDVSSNLLEAAISQYSSNSNFRVNLTPDDLSCLPNVDFDFSVSIHVAELCSSVERLFYTLSKSSKYSAVIWYEYPRTRFTELEIREFVNHDNATKKLQTPYLRNRFSSDYYEFLLRKNSLEVIKSYSVSEKDRLDLYRSKNEK